MSPPPGTDLPSQLAPQRLSIRRFEWEPDEKLTARTWAYSALLDSVPVGVQAIIFRADRTILYLPPEIKTALLPADFTAESVVVALADRIDNDLAGHHICFRQAAIDVADASSARALRIARFQRLTEVWELTLDMTGMSPDDSSLQHSDLHFVPAPLTSKIWEQVFEASLDSSLDVPELAALRGAAEAFASLCALAAGETELWRVLLTNGTPVGIVLPTLLPDGSSEIQYMGVADGHRRQGHGQRLLRYAVQAVVYRGASLLSVHVDERNLPALSLYESSGFRKVARRTLWIR